MDQLPQPPEQAMLYEDEFLYACLASYPLTTGHTVVVWKSDKKDIHELSKAEYSHLMSVVERMRDKLLTELGVEKVYLMYMDEIEHVHWHLIPRYDEQGYNVLKHKPKLTDDFTLASRLSL
ncbi:HIT family protein [Candidatus Saccharibacteria bacterium]|nr:HIT family protein [Candidatus Saccharibacteria bacterium]